MLFCLVQSFRETENIQNYEKKCLKLFRKTEKNISFRIFAYFQFNFLPSLQILNLLLEFCTFHSSFVPLFEFHTVEESPAPITNA